MRRQIFRTPLAWRDLEESADFIAKDSLEAALRFYDAAEAAIFHLAEMPGLGTSHIFRNSPLGEIRMWPVPDFENWMIFYRASDVSIEVIRVLHKARDIPAIFDTP